MNNPKGHKHDMTTPTSDGHAETVVVTGATGLIGRSLTAALVRNGYRVVAFVRNVDRRRRRLLGCLSSSATRLGIREASSRHSREQLQS
jgi:nucleoside-diphosphate-sugar epimerase